MGEGEEALDFTSECRQKSNIHRIILIAVLVVSGWEEDIAASYKVIPVDCSL